ncbi:hypothetical protein F4808DRAFT_461836 [Astrocystis sublimbata]|nr:hypothetical protein F4808DRAFT_461836 [Astrocystis sublimbata]
MDDPVSNLETAESKDVVDAIGFFLRNNGATLAGPTTIRLAHRENDGMLLQPRMVLEADLRYDNDLPANPVGGYLSLESNDGNALGSLAHSGDIIPTFDHTNHATFMDTIGTGHDFRYGHDFRQSWSALSQDIGAFDVIQRRASESSPWNIGNDADMEMNDLFDSASPISVSTAFVTGGEERNMMSVFPGLESTTNQRVFGSANISDLSSAGSFTNSLMLSDTSSPELMHLGSPSSTVITTAATTPSMSVTADSPRMSRSPSITTRGPRATCNKGRKIALSASRNVMREDYLQYLKTEVSGWISNRQWLVSTDAHAEQAPTTEKMPTYSDLELAYSTVCKLDTRISIDVIRSRLALIRLHREYVRACDCWDAGAANGSSLTDIGRGKTSFIIDHILRRIHQDWQSLDNGAREALRAKFHSQKRFGKRWLLMMEALGPGILLICSHKLANMIRNSAVTIQMLEEVAQRVRRSQCGAARVLEVLKPVADSMFSGEIVDANEFDTIVRELESISENSPN